MNVGGPNGGPVCDLNVTPLIDVLLTLIIVFMLVTTQVKSTGLEALVPHPPEKSDTAIPPERTVVVQLIDSGGERPDLMINREPVSWEGLRARLIEIYKTRAERVLFVQADRQTEFEYVASVIDVAHGDFQDMRVGLLTEQLGQ